MRRVAFDIETNGLVNPTKIHVIVCIDIDTGEEFVFDEDFHAFVNFAKEVSLWIGHNSIYFDHKILTHFFGIVFPKKQCFDTLVLSQLLNADREGGHSLEAWGTRLGFPKQEHEDWSIYSPAMRQRCITDTQLTVKLYHHLMKVVNRNGSAFDKAIKVEMLARWSAREMSDNGFRFNITDARALYLELEQRRGELDKLLLESFEPKVEYIQLKTKVKDYIIEKEQCLLRLPKNVGRIIKDTIKKIEKGLSEPLENTTQKIERISTKNEKKDITQTEIIIEGKRESGIIVTLSTLGNTIETDCMACLLESMTSCLKNKEDAALYVNAIRNSLSIIVTEPDVFVDCSALNAILLSDNTKLLEKLQKATSPRLKELVTHFNPGSPKQIVDRLWEAGWKPINKTKTHELAERNKCVTDRHKRYGWKVDETNLSTLPEGYPKGFDVLLEHMIVSSRMRTLTEWMNVYNPDTGRIHGTFNPLGTKTHRCVHSSPNMGNIATKKTIKYNSERLRKLATDLGGRMRAMWICDDDTVLVGTDMESAHLRIFAHLINDKEFINALITGRKEDGTDPHSVNKRKLGHVCVDRDRSKTFIFTYLNGGTANRVRTIFGCTLSEARTALEGFVASYPGLKRLREERIPVDAARGYFQGVDGRLVVNDSEHLMIGMYLQNMESVLMKHACEMWKGILDRLKIDYRLINWVHDEWVTEVKGGEEVAKKVGRIQAWSIAKVGKMFKLNCPMGGESKIGKDWLEVH